MRLHTQLIVALALLALAGTCEPAAAQHRHAPSSLRASAALPPVGRAAGLLLPGAGMAPQLSAVPAERSSLALAVGGVVGGALGFVGGSLIGTGLGLSFGDGEYRDLEGAILLGIVGESVVLPLGVHIANDSRGSYGRPLLASVAIAALGVTAARATGHPAPLLVVPVAQIATSIVLERQSAR